MPHPPSLPVLTVANLHFSWPHGPLFKGLSFMLQPGVSQVLGDDGCGKTTLLKIIAGELPPLSGAVALPGLTLGNRPEAWHQQVFWVDPQTDALDAISAANWLGSLGQRYPDFRPDVLSALVDGFDLVPHLEKPLFMLSTGSKRKVWLSAAFASGAPLTLIDHPFAALDGPSIRFLTELLQEAASHPTRAWVLADYTAANGVALDQIIQL